MVGKKKKSKYYILVYFRLKLAKRIFKSANKIVSFLIYGSVLLFISVFKYFSRNCDNFYDIAVSRNGPLK